MLDGHSFVRVSCSAVEGWLPSPSCDGTDTGLGFAYQGCSLLGILHELAHGFSCVLVIHHLWKKLRRNGDDVGPGQRSVLNVNDCTDAAHNNPRRQVPLVKPATHVADHNGGVTSLIGHAPAENAHIRRPRFGGKDGLVESKNCGGVNADAFLCQLMNNTKARFSELVYDGNFDDDISRPCCE